MTRHTLRDLMIGLQGAMICLAAVSIADSAGGATTAAIMAWLAAFTGTPSRLPPRNERGQFSERD